MAKATKHQKIVAALHADPEYTRDVAARTSRYVVFNHTIRSFNLYVGNKGAVRIGKTVTTSVPVSPSKIDEWVKQGERALSG